MSLKVWLPLIGDTHNQGISGIVATPAANATVNVAGKIGSCYNFDGSTNAYITLSEAPFDNTVEEFSYACWINPAYVTASMCLFSNRSAVDSTGITIFLFNSGNILFDVGNRWTQSTSLINANTWTHLTFTYKKGVGRKIYINGVETYTNGTGIAPTAANATKAFIGASQNTNTTVNANYFKGKINDIRIYDHCLSVAEIHRLAQGLICHYRLNDLCGVNLLQTNPDLVITEDSTDASQYSSYVYLHPIVKESGALVEGTIVTVTYDYYVTKVSTGTASAIYLYSQLNNARLTPSISQTIIRTEPKGHIVETFKVTEAQANYSSTFRLRWRLVGGAATDSVTIKNPRFYIGDTAHKDMIYDSSGYQHHIPYDFAIDMYENTEFGKEEFSYLLEDGTGSSIFSYGMLTSDTPRYDVAVQYHEGWQSDTTYRSSMFGGMPLTNATIAAWMKPTDVGSSITQGIGFYSQNQTNNTIKQFMISMNTSGYFGARVGVGSSTTPQMTTQKMVLNEWHHYAITLDGTTCKFYYDGEYITSRTLSLSAGSILQEHVGIVIGETGTDGSIAYYSDIRVYATTLLDADIKQLYNVGMKVDKNQNFHAFGFDEVNNKTQFTKTGLIQSGLVAEDLLMDSKAHIGKTSYNNILFNDLEVITTKISSNTTGTLPNLTAAQIESLAGKTLRFTYDVNTTGTRLSTENGDTAWQKTRYGIHGGFSYTNAAGSTGTSYPFASYLEYSGEATRAVQTWTVPTGYQVYGPLNFSIQPFDKPASTNNETWFIKNVRLEVVDDSNSGYVTGNQLIEF